MTESLSTKRSQCPRPGSWVTSRLPSGSIEAVASGGVTKHTRRRPTWYGLPRCGSHSHCTCSVPRSRGRPQRSLGWEMTLAGWKRKVAEAAWLGFGLGLGLGLGVGVGFGFGFGLGLGLGFAWLRRLQRRRVRVEAG